MENWAENLAFEPPAKVGDIAVDHFQEMAETAPEHVAVRDKVDTAIDLRVVDNPVDVAFSWVFPRCQSRRQPPFD